MALVPSTEKAEQTLWAHLPLLLRANSKETVEYILQALWRTRKTGLDSADRTVIRDILQLQNESDLDPLLVCLRMLMRKCVNENVSKDDIPKLFPAEVLPELQKLLTLLLHKFQQEWRQDGLRDQLHSDSRLHSGNLEVKSQLAKDTLETMLKSMHSIRDQLSAVEDASNLQ